jgi:hypothetical protein
MDLSPSEDDEVIKIAIDEERISESIILDGERIRTEHASIRNFIPGPALYLENGKIIFSDLNAIGVYLIDGDGITKIVNRGKDYDELLAIDEIVKTEEGFAVMAASCGSIPKIMFINNSREIYSTNEIYTIISGMSLYKDGFAAVSPLAGAEYLVNYYLNTGDEYPSVKMVSANFQKYKLPKERTGDFAYATLIATDRDNIYVTNKLLNYHAIYDEDGKLINQVNIKDSLYKEINLKARVFQGDKLINNDICVDENGYIFIAKYGLHGTKGRIDVFTREGILLDILIVHEEPSYINCNANKLIVSDSEGSKTIYLYDYSELVEKWKGMMIVETEA